MTKKEMEARIEELEEELEALQEEYEQEYELDDQIKPAVNTIMALMRGFKSKGLPEKEAMELTKLVMMWGAK